jgi:Mg-chelatase subunit ChlD
MNRILYDVPKWHGIVGREARGMKRIVMDSTDGAVDQFGDEVFDRLYAGGGEELAQDKKHASLATWGQKFHAAAEQSPDWQRLVASCHGDAIAAAIATDAVVKAVEPKLDDAPDKDEGPKTGPGGRPLPKKVTVTDRLRVALTRVAAAAAQEIDEVREAIEGAEGVGPCPGQGAGNVGTIWEAKAIRARAKAIRDNPHLKRIMEMAGRFKRVAATKRRARVKHGADEVTDVEQGDNLSRLLPTEAMKFLDPDTEIRFFSDFLERRLLQYRLEGKEPAKKGPVIVAIDKSGSMSGMPDEWATAVALAVMDTAHADKRPFAFLCFDSYVTHEQIVQVGQKLDPQGLLVQAGGGTDIGVAFRRALDIIEANRGGALGKADVIVITDGGSGPMPELRERAAAMGVHTIGIGIGVAKEYLTPFSDEQHVIEKLSATLDGRLADALFAA